MGLLRTAGKVAVATRVHGSVQRRQRDRWAQQGAGTPPPPPSPPSAAPPPTAPAPATSSTADIIGLLTQLGDLRDSGVLTPEEFETQKARILGSSEPG